MKCVHLTHTCSLGYLLNDSTEAWDDSSYKMTQPRTFHSLHLLPNLASLRSGRADSVGDPLGATVNTLTPGVQTFIIREYLPRVINSHEDKSFAVFLSDTPTSILRYKASTNEFNYIYRYCYERIPDRITDHQDFMIDLTSKYTLRCIGLLLMETYIAQNKTQITIPTTPWWSSFSSEELCKLEKKRSLIKERRGRRTSVIGHRRFDRGERG